EKIIVFRYKSKVRYRRKTGHRQSLTRVRITDILLDGASAAPRREETEPTPAPAVVAETSPAVGAATSPTVETPASPTVETPASAAAPTAASETPSVAASETPSVAASETPSVAASESAGAEGTSAPAEQ